MAISRFNDVIIGYPDGSIIGRLGYISETELTPSKEDTESITENFLDTYRTEGEFEIPVDYCIRRAIAIITDSPLAKNNWRKMHRIPMWRK